MEKTHKPRKAAAPIGEAANSSKTRIKVYQLSVIQCHLNTGMGFLSAISILESKDLLVKVRGRLVAKERAGHTEKLYLISARHIAPVVKSCSRIAGYPSCLPDKPTPTYLQSMTRFFHLLVSKRRKINFEVSILIREIVNVPLFSGFFYVNWQLRNASDSTGTTKRVFIRNHQVMWNCPIKAIVPVLIDSDHVLSHTELKLDVYQHDNKQLLGTVSVNLAEFAGRGFLTERYLLQNCKFNSTLKLSINMVKKAKPASSASQMTQKSSIIPTNALKVAALTKSPELPCFRVPPPSRPTNYFLSGSSETKAVLQASKIRERLPTNFGLVASSQLDSPRTARLRYVRERNYFETLNAGRARQEGLPDDTYENPYDLVERLFDSVGRKEKVN